MDCTIAKLLKRIHENMPEASASITTEAWVYKEGVISVVYNLYVRTGEDFTSKDFMSIKELERHVNEITGTLTVNQVLNAGGSSLVVE